MNKITGLIWQCAVVMMLLCSAWTFRVEAQDKFVAEPRIEMGFQYDENFHRSQENERSVLTFSMKPGITLGYDTDKSQFLLDYDANALDYDDRGSVPAGSIEADAYSYVEHRARLSAQSRITRRILLGVDNTFWSTRDPANADAASNAVDRYKYSLNEFRPRMVYNFGDKFGLGLAYTHKLTDYTRDDPGRGEDSVENRGGVTLFYYLNSDTSLDLDYQTWAREYDRDSIDYDSQQLMVNFNKTFNFLTLRMGAGFQDRTFDQDLAGGDIRNFAWKIGIKGENRAKGGETPKNALYFSVGQNLNDAGSGNTYYQATRVDAGLSRMIFSKVNVKLDGWYQNADYETSSREDDRWNASLGFEHFITDAFSWGVKGGLEDRDSSEDGLDYTNHYFMFNVKFNHDMGGR